MYKGDVIMYLDFYYCFFLSVTSAPAYEWKHERCYKHEPEITEYMGHLFILEEKDNSSTEVAYISPKQCIYRCLIDKYPFALIEQGQFCFCTGFGKSKKE